MENEEKEWKLKLKILGILFVVGLAGIMLTLMSDFVRSYNAIGLGSLIRDIMSLFILSIAFGMWMVFFYLTYYICARPLFEKEEQNYQKIRLKNKE